MDERARKILDGVHDSAREEYVMILSDECEKVLKDLFERYKPQRVLEIGTAIGYSSSLMALYSDCTVDTIEKDKDRIERAKQLWKTLGVEDRIHSYEGDADEILASVVEGKTYDFVFIDGAKSAYKKQLEFLLPGRPNFCRKQSGWENFSLPSHTSLKLSFLSSCLSLR